MIRIRVQGITAHAALAMMGQAYGISPVRLFKMTMQQFAELVADARKKAMS